MHSSSCINPNALAEAPRHPGFAYLSIAWGQRQHALESSWTTRTKRCPHGSACLPCLLGRAPLVLASRPCGTRPPGLGPALQLLRLQRHLRCAERPPLRLALAALLPERAYAAPDGVGGLPGVVGIEALLLQALPRVALQPPPRQVLPPRPLPRPLLARPEPPQSWLLLAQLQRREGPAALCRRSSHHHQARLMDLLIKQ